MTIERLTQTDAVASGDQLSLWSVAAGDDRRVALSVVVAYLQALLTLPTTLKTQYEQPTATGFTLTVEPIEQYDSMHLLIAPNAAYAAGTVYLPPQAECIDGQEVLVTSTQAVTTFTLNGNGATAVNGAPTTMVENGFFRMKYDGVYRAWYRIG